jgi:hypothetical protein
MQIGSGVYPACCPMGTDGSFLWVRPAGAWKQPVASTGVKKLCLYTSTPPPRPTMGRVLCSKAGSTDCVLHFYKAANRTD